jgi:hypothetical protein
MSDNKAAAADAPAKKKRTASKKKSGAKAPAGGTYQAYIVDAIKTLKERGGSSRQAIKAYVQQNNKVSGVLCDVRAFPRFLFGAVLFFPPKFGPTATARLPVLPGPSGGGTVCSWDVSGWFGGSLVWFGAVICCGSWRFRARRCATAAMSQSVNLESSFQQLLNVCAKRHTFSSAMSTAN